MSKQIHRVEDLSVSDFKKFPVWQFLNEDRKGETAVVPVRELPIQNLDGCLVGTQVRLANGTRVWALMGNVSTSDARRTKHFLTLSVFHEAHRFTVARYFDSDFNERGPDALARFLGLGIEQVFPISYDLTQFVIGDNAALKGTIEVEPPERLTRAERIALSVQ